MSSLNAVLKASLSICHDLDGGDFGGLMIGSGKGVVANADELLFGWKKR